MTEAPRDNATNDIHGVGPSVERTGRNGWLASLVVIHFAALLVYLAGNASVSLWDRDEPRYAQTSRQMLQSGDWVVPRFLDEVRTAKPVFIYWCQAASMSVFGDTAFAARLPSAVAMLLTLLLLSCALWRTLGQQCTTLTILILASGGLVIAAAKMCLTDAVLLFWIMLAQLCLLQIVRRRGSWPVWLALGFAVGCAGLTKGPVVLGVMGTTLIVLYALHLVRPADSVPLHAQTSIDREAVTHRAPHATPMKVAVTLLIVGAICAPWLFLIHRRAPDFLPTIIGHDVINRMRSGLEGHSGPPGYYLLTIWATYFPWSLMLPAALIYGWKQRRDPLTRFALAAVIGPWAMFELIRTKLPHYLLPVFPPLAVLTARMLVDSAHAVVSDVTNRAFRVTATLWCGMVALLAMAPLAVAVVGQLGPSAVATSGAFALVGLVYAVSCWRRFRARQPARAAMVMGFGMFALILILYAGFLPNVQPLRTSARVADILRREGAHTVGSVVMIGYKEPSLAFYQGGTIREESNDRFLAEIDAALWPRWVVMTEALWHSMPTHVRDQMDVVERVSGFWYASKGRMVNVLILRTKA